MKNLFVVLFLLLSVTVIYSQPEYTQKDVEICTSKFELAVDSSYASLPINEIIVRIGKSFLGLDYAANSLEKGDTEHLVVYLTGLDCYTFLESSLVFARCIKNGKTSFADYMKELENIRYRSGKINGYPSRLHYFSDWIYDMNKRGIAKDVTRELGGERFDKKINFMSTHVDSYKQLKKNPKFVSRIKKIESEISSRKYYYIPQDSIAELEKGIHDGDIIGITTNIEGLDISHTGIAVKMNDGRIHFMHAPNVGKKIQITEKPLAEYIQGNSKQTGIMVARPE